MAEKTRQYDYGQLIEFIRPASSDSCTWQPKPATETPSTITGDEARSFYEDLCTDDEEGKQQTNTTSTSEVRRSKRKTASQHHRKSKKRSRQEGSSVCNGSISGRRKITNMCPNSSDHVEQYLSKIDTLDSNMTSSRNSACTSRKADLSDKTMTLKENQRTRDHCKSELFRLAQNGQAEDLKVLLERGVDVNCVDQYGWTAAMSAAFEGHISVVQILVKSGADLTIRNSQGLTALSLALKKGHSQVVEFIKIFQMVGLKALKSQKKEKDYIIRFYCDVCKSEFSDSDQSTHQRSTVHIFNMGQKPKDDTFLIPPSNIGYRLMMKTGWDGNKGLGPSGEGQKYPIKTVLKQDRKGLGNVKEKAKVTHFKANDKSAVTRMKSEGDQRVASARTMSRRAQKAKERKERQWEVNIRHQLS